MDPQFKRHLNKAKQWTISTLKRKTAADFQRMIRAEAGAYVGYVDVVQANKIESVWVRSGEVACITCGRVAPWQNTKSLGMAGMDAGHFLPGRFNSILFEEVGVHTQCVGCNRGGGMPGAYHLYMLERYGPEAIDRLRYLKTQPKKFTKEELVSLRLEYRKRLKQAIERMDA